MATMGCRDCAKPRRDILLRSGSFDLVRRRHMLVLFVLRDKGRGRDHTYLEDHGFLVWITQAENLAYFMIKGTYHQR